jgi:hypothetical protein
MDDYRKALRREFRDLRRRDRDDNVERAMESLSELNAEGVARLGPPYRWAATYRAEAGVRKRHTRAWIVGGLLLATALAVVACVIWVRGYTLTVNSYGESFYTPEAPASPGDTAVYYKLGSTFYIQASVHNGGVLPVELVGVVDGPAYTKTTLEVPAEAWVMAKSVDVPGGYVAPRAKRIPFPVHLARGEWATFMILFREGRACVPDAAGSTRGLLGGYSLRVRVAGLSEEDLPISSSNPWLSFPAAVTTMPHCGEKNYADLHFPDSPPLLPTP